MSITDPRSVLILGAGMSAPFKLPLGDALVDLISDQIGREATRATGERRTRVDAQVVVDWAGHARDWYSNPIYGTVLRTKMEGRGLTFEAAQAAHQDLASLRNLLSNQTAETIDAFIAENPGIAATAKLALAAMMLRASYVLDPNHVQLVLRPFSGRTNNTFCERDETAERNWMHLLINIVRHGIDLGDLQSGQKVKIITFNYDTVLEHVLAKQFANREAKLSDYSNHFEILHAHGAFGELLEHCQDPAKCAIDWAGGIYAVKETGTSAEMVQTRNRIREVIANAGNIYSIGFAFAGPNCRLLGLSNPPRFEDRRITYCNYDGNRGTSESVERYFRGSDVFEKAGDAVRPLGASAFIKAGYLGETPS